MRAKTSPPERRGRTANRVVWFVLIGMVLAAVIAGVFHGGYSKTAAADDSTVVTAELWHSGYVRQNDDVYWRWRHGLSCKEYALNGCWHVEVITRNGCRSYVAVNANEYSGQVIIDELLDNQAYGIPPKTSRIFELFSDSEQSGSTAGDVHIDCS